ncbi:MULTISPECIES: hypothetical protein [unclassified Micromonospora]|uniref:hypothetical protein n=1 Tax=unclassified Micromonospora TaxID=2617518 RepID=UPI002FF2B5AF
MSLKLLPVDEVWVDRMITLADVPWERATVEAMFVEWGLARPGEDVGWEGGPGAPQFAVDHEGEPSGWLVELGAAPPDPDVWVHLPCALYWPAFGAEEPDDPDDEDEHDEDLPPLWARQPDARRAKFHAERDRLAALITTRLGTPESVVTGAYDSYRAVWRRGDRALLLETTDDIHTYSHYDVLGIRLRRYDRSLTDLDT